MNKEVTLELPLEVFIGFRPRGLAISKKFAANNHVLKLFAQIPEIGIISKALLVSAYFFLVIKPQVDGQRIFIICAESFETLDALGLQQNILMGIYAYGFSKHYAVKLGIAPLCNGLNVFLASESTNGKIAILASGILPQLDYNWVVWQTLILPLNSEIFQQIDKVIQVVEDCCLVSNFCHDFDMLQNQLPSTNHIQMSVFFKAEYALLEFVCFMHEFKLFKL